eukprot:CAMPEP_0113463066 /NCGR_PEP_ID=MMETSP0014_2-20120614/12444_1 /TAXON_ID=2857 /ORGANISM="Nitzschia sp." /LENGTH=575 /DNA_ID=CAMNT_0000355005 /DNA_START=70 /DNA_END=1797 /DNA_ORIENTATION=+ /assembly_acc=CAM_ASM_000159
MPRNRDLYVRRHAYDRNACRLLTVDITTVLLLLLPSTTTIVYQQADAQTTTRRIQQQQSCTIAGDFNICPVSSSFVTFEQLIFLDAELKCPLDTVAQSTFIEAARQGQCSCDVDLYLNAPPDNGGTFVSDLTCKCFLCPEGSRANGYAYSCESPIIGSCYAFDCFGRCVEEQGFDPTVDGDSEGTTSKPSESNNSPAPSLLPSIAPSLTPTVVATTESPTAITASPTVVETSIAPTTNVETVLPTSVPTRTPALETVSPTTALPSAIRTVSPTTTEPTTGAVTVSPTTLVPTIVETETPVLTATPTTPEPIVAEDVIESPSTEPTSGTITVAPTPEFVPITGDQITTTPPPSTPPPTTVPTSSGQFQLVPVPTLFPPTATPPSQEQPAETPSGQGPLVVGPIIPSQPTSPSVPTTSQEMAPTCPGAETEPTSMPTTSEGARPTVIRPTFSEPLPQDCRHLTNPPSSIEEEPSTTKAAAPDVFVERPSTPSWPDGIIIEDQNNNGFKTIDATLIEGGSSSSSSEHTTTLMNTNDDDSSSASSGIYSLISRHSFNKNNGVLVLIHFFVCIDILLAGC